MVTDFHHGTKPIQSVAPKQQVGLAQSLWWMVFLADTVTLSMVLQHFKKFTLVPNMANGLWLLLTVTVLVLFTGALIYGGYAKEKVNGKLKNAFPLFEWIYSQQTGDVKQTDIDESEAPRP